MDLFETSTQSFIVKIWIEETAEEASRTLWRGHITHALSGERRYFQNLDEIQTFMKPYLQEMGIKLDGHQSLKQWWQRWKLCLKARKLTDNKGG